jgi:multidrug efflux pump subunit AcrB
VREGQQLVVLDSREMESSVSRAESAREEVRSAIPEAESGIAAAKAQLDFAQVTFNRMQDLLSKRSITNQEFDEASARLKATQAGLDMASAKRTQLDSKLAQIEQEIRFAGIQRGYAEITAPFSGTILNKSVEAGSRAVPGAPLFTIEREGAYRLEASVEESRLYLARVGKAVSVSIDGIGQTFSARIVEIVPSVDPATRTGTVRDVGKVADGGGEPSEYVRYSQGGGSYPAVTIAISKRQGTNAVTVADNVLSRIGKLKGNVLPSDVELAITHNYGDPAKEKSNDLLEHMLIVVISVSVLIAIALGFRESLIVFIAIPVTLALTLTVFYLYGYTLNRITLFALTFSIGILVDDAIVVVENIVRHWRIPANRERPSVDVAVEAVDEVGNPTILATLVVVAAILPIGFVSGLAGPYMRPIPIGGTAAVLFSLIVAFLVTPWAAVRILKHGPTSHEPAAEDFFTRFYRRIMAGLLHRTVARWCFLAGILFLLVGSCSLFYFGAVQLKMLPFDNKSEFQVIVDMPNGTTLEETARVTQLLAVEVQKQAEVVNLQTYVGTASPYNFNGLVRHYYLRKRQCCGPPNQLAIEERT